MLIAKFYYVYVLTNYNKTVLYTGVTSNLNTRIWQHKVKISPNSFTAKYNCDRLIYFEEFESISSAITREKQIKKWRRKWKEDLIDKNNPGWIDLSEDWFKPDELNRDLA